MITLTKKDLKNYPNLLVFTEHWKGDLKHYQQQNGLSIR